MSADNKPVENLHLMVNEALALCDYSPKEGDHESFVAMIDKLPHRAKLDNLITNCRRAGGVEGCPNVVELTEGESLLVVGGYKEHKPFLGIAQRSLADALTVNFFEPESSFPRLMTLLATESGDLENCEVRFDFVPNTSNVDQKPEVAGATVE